MARLAAAFCVTASTATAVMAAMGARQDQAAGQIAGHISQSDTSAPIAKLRRIERYTVSAPVKDGRYHLVGAVPGDYFAFAASARDDHPYFAVDFADRHSAEALRVTVAPGSSTILDLKAIRSPGI